MPLAGVASRIADALLEHLGALEIGSPTYPIAMPNRFFSPPAGPYLRASFLPARPDAPFLGEQSTERHQGILQVSVMWPAGDDGIILASEAAQAVIAHFPRGTMIVTDGVTVRVEQPAWVSPPLPDADRLQVPVTIPWVAFV